MPLKSALKSTISKKSPSRKNKTLRIKEYKNVIVKVSPYEDLKKNTQTLVEEQNARAESKKELQAEMMNKTSAEKSEINNKGINRKYNKYYQMREYYRNNKEGLPRYINVNSFGNRLRKSIANLGRWFTPKSKGGERMSKKTRSKKNRK